MWGAALVLIILVVGLGSTSWDYFVRYPACPELPFFFEEAATRLATDVNRFLGSGWAGEGWRAQEGEPLTGRWAFVEQRLWEEWAAVPFLVAETVTTQPEKAPPEGASVLLALWPHEDYWGRLDLLSHPARIRVWEGPLARGDLYPHPFVAYIAFAAEPAGEEPAEPAARFEGGINLLDAAVACREGKWWVELVWEATAPVEEDYTVFVHLADGDTPLAQADQDPAGGYYPTSMWQAGDQIVDVHSFTPPEVWQDAPRLTAGLYLRQTLQRLAVVDAEGQRVGDTVSLPTPSP
jgi:hypothetical protein